ncbi:MAG TPA: aldehyde dehydrogenase family protein, partial [Candidatus Kapabacteria bacterium]|nr:aldehyde dehydrogenase family protein [Candidatus Kapabacteria bacterium]
GPVLGVVRFERLEEAIEFVNATGYGLTSGLHSLDEREHELWKSRILAGNLYINRGTTGAVVLRQPFGGMGKSCVGPGMKAGGPNYVAQFLQFEERGTPANQHEFSNPELGSLASALSAFMRPNTPGDEPGWDLSRTAKSLGLTSLLEANAQRLLVAISSYDGWWQEEFGREHDHFRLLGQDNIRRYLPFQEIRVRVAEGDTLFDLVCRACAAHVTGARVIVSSPVGVNLAAVKLLDEITDSWAAAIEFVEESDGDIVTVIREMPDHSTERIRYAGARRVPEIVRRAAAEQGVYIADEPVIAAGRIELLWYLREQSISWDYHRYGNLGGRADETRRGPVPARKD